MRCGLRPRHSRPGSGSQAPLVVGVVRHFRRCGFQPRPFLPLPARSGKNFPATDHSFGRQLGQLATTLPKVKKNKRGGWSAGGRTTLKTMKTAPRTWKAGGTRMYSRGAGVLPARRPESGKQAKRPMFSVISHPAVRLEAALSGSHTVLVQKLPRHFRGCGILPRPSGWRAGARRRGEGARPRTDPMHAQHKERKANTTPSPVRQFRLFFPDSNIYCTA